MASDNRHLAVVNVLREHGASVTKCFCTKAAEQMVVSVTDPVKKTESLGIHICYRVRTRVRGAIVNDVDVERRYNHFKALSEQLAEELPDSIVPPLPDSQAIGRFVPEFVEK